MRVRLTQNIETYNGKHKAGDEVDLSSPIASVLIQRGHAEMIEPQQANYETTENTPGRGLEQQVVSISDLANSAVPSEELPNPMRPEPREVMGADGEVSPQAATMPLDAAENENESNPTRDLNAETTAAKEADNKDKETEATRAETHARMAAARKNTAK